MVEQESRPFELELDLEDGDRHSQQGILSPETDGCWAWSPGPAAEASANPSL